MSRGPTPPPPPLTPKPHWVFVKFSVATVGHQSVRSLHSMVRSFHLIAGAPNKDIVQNHLTKHC